MVHSFLGRVPKLHPAVSVHDSAHVIGDVAVEEDASVWLGTALCGDVNRIRVGRGTNLQDDTVVHVNRRGQPTLMGDFVTVGHAVRPHGCRSASHCLVDIGSMVPDGVELGEACLVAAGARVPPGMKVPARSVLTGSPATVGRPAGAHHLEWIHRSAQDDIALKPEYRGTARRASGSTQP